MYCDFDEIDFVRANIHHSSHLTQLYIFEDFAAVIDKNIKTTRQIHQRSNTHGRNRDSDVAFAPAFLKDSFRLTKLYLFKDNSAIQMVNKGRITNLRHATRTHRVNADWLFERNNLDQSIRVTVHTFARHTFFGARASLAQGLRQETRRTLRVPFLVYQHLNGLDSAILSKGESPNPLRFKVSRLPKCDDN